MAKSQTKTEAYQEITAAILDELRNGARPWSPKWDAGTAINAADSLRGFLRPLRSTGKPYRGANVFWLMLRARQKGYKSRYWLTFRQALADKGSVRKGEKGTPVSFWKFSKVRDASTGETKTVPFMRAYTVFNAEQCDNLPERYIANAAPKLPSEFERYEAAEAFARATGAHIGDSTDGRAYYIPAFDQVCMPARVSFKTPSAYYGTLLHELTHWTGHASRLDRFKPMTRFGSANYAFEELTAELGAAYLCADLEIPNHERADHASYIASWIKLFEDHPKALFSAAAAAEKAAAYLHGASETEDDESAADEYSAALAARTGGPDR
jgi:antirestriction protein ArdC